VSSATSAFDHVALDDVSRAYGRRRAVSKVTLGLRAGEILGLLGPNGAGKSTLIGMLATLVAPSSGTIRYGRLSAATDGASIRSQVGLLGHELHLYADLTARQNLEFFRQLYQVQESSSVAVALDAAGLTDRADDEVAAFSRGMRQRLALERALLHRPRLVLLDEPFTGLDDRAVGTVSSRLRGLSAGGAIVVLATHDLDLADGLITRAVVVRQGRVVADEAARGDLRAHYRAIVGSA
jgi:ABC-type multidrug transport system ATPase subunit